MTPIARLRDVRKIRQGRDRSFELLVTAFDLSPGECAAVTGPSGSGKSTFIHLLALALAPTDTATFAIFTEGKANDVAELWHTDHHRGLAQLRARSLGYVLQTGGLLPFLSARDNILLPLHILGRDDAGELTALSDELGLTDLLDEKPDQLSVGERQRVAIARALIHRPPLVLADEPTASLDPENAHIVMSMLIRAARRQKAAVVIATHDRDLIDTYDLAAIDMHIEPTKEGLVTQLGRTPE